MPPPVDRVPQTEIERVREGTRACFQAASDAGIGVDVAVDIGHPAAEILGRAATLPADLIVMGTHGAGGSERLALGSVAEKVIRKTACPVLTVPPRAHATTVLPFKRLLCAVDFSEPSLAALAFGRSLARESGAVLTLLHVIEWPWPRSGSTLTTCRPNRRFSWRNSVAISRQVPWPGSRACPGCRSVTLHQPARAEPRKPGTLEILRIAGEVQADLIIIGLHGRSAAGLMLFGSTTNQVVRHATCPVLTLKH